MATQAARKSWIEQLADQSWEAELIISGVAIFGSLNLPPVIYRFSNWCLDNFAQDYLDFMEFIIIYLFMAVQLLIAGFIVHFLMRILWVGLVGLSSVYPEGVTDSPRYSADFNQKLKKEFPDLQGFVKKLDDQASLIFALASTAVMVFSAIIIVASISLALASLLHYFLPGIPLKTFLTGILVMGFVPYMVLSFIFNLASFKEKEWVQSIHFPLYKVYNRIIYTLFYQPVNYILLTLTSHFDSKRYIISMMVSMVLLTLYLTIILAMTDGLNLTYFNEDIYFNKGKRINSLYSNAYDDRRPIGRPVYHASIPSDIIGGPYLQVFVPIPVREEMAKEALCDTISFDSTTWAGHEEEKKWLRELACEQRFHTFFLNDSMVKPYDLRYHYDFGMHQEGLLATLPTQSCVLGRNLVKIEKAFVSKEGKQRIILIPFYYDPTPHKLNVSPTSNSAKQLRFEPE